MLCSTPSMTKASSASRLQVDGRLARARMRDELGDHGIVEHGDLGALEHAGIVAHGAAIGRAFLGRPIPGEPADRGQEIAEGVLGVDAALHRPAVQLHVRLLES